MFLAHSSLDVEYLPGVISVLEGHGGSVYIDKADSGLPQKTSSETGNILRSTIKGCRRFVMFVTTNSKSSCWIPWELGLADGEKGHYPLALFPTAATAAEQDWAEQEYLGLYRRIVWGKIKGWTAEGWLVHDHINNAATGLSDWIAGN